MSFHDVFYYVIFVSENNMRCLKSLKNSKEGKLAPKRGITKYCAQMSKGGDQHQSEDGSPRRSPSNHTTCELHLACMLFFIFC